MDVPLRPSLFLAAAMAVLGIAPVVASDDQAAQRVIAKLSPKDLTPGLTKAIADVGQPTKVTVAANATLRTVVASHCGRDDANFVALLKERPESLGIPPDQISPDYVFLTERTLELPYCLRLPGAQKSSGLMSKYNPPESMMDGPWKIAAQTANYGTYGSPTDIYSGPFVYSAWDRHVPAYGWSDHLRSAQPEYVALPIRNGMLLDQAVASLNTEAPQKARPEQKGIQHITVLSSTDDKCAAVNNKILAENYPVDTYGILRVLGLNEAARPGRISTRTPILIGDSGLYPDALPGAAPIVTREDPKEMEPTESYARRQHGTYVASAALGGPYFMRFWPLLQSPIIIRARNIISKDSGCKPIRVAGTTTLSGEQDYCDIDDARLAQLLSASGAGGIVNLSVSRADKIVAIENELLRARDRYLIVAAAGNSGKRIADNSYPAMLAAGDLENNVLVVAALESAGDKLSDDSSYHDRWVEISAYGCKVPVYERTGGASTSKFETVRQSGTSMAAPLVAFAAALLKQQMEMSPVLLKKRLLISADYEPGLEGQVKNNAKLNIPRALALFHDVVELETGKPIYGRLKGEDFALALCGGRKAQRRSELRSLSIDRSKPEKRAFFYHAISADPTNPYAGLQFSDCLLSEQNPRNRTVDLADYRLTIIDAETNVEKEFTLGQLKNITFAHKPYWEN